jgi:HPt (histidine-containing phosphotransfer) domain-containing protein
MRDAGIADDQFIQEIVKMFLEEAKSTLIILEDSINNKIQAQINLQAHKLKSSFLMFDMIDAHIIASELEDSSQMDQIKLTEKFSTLNNICNKFFVLIEKKYL